MVTGVASRFAVGLLAALLLATCASQTAGAVAVGGKQVTRAVERQYEKFPVRSTIYGVWVDGRPVVRGALGRAEPGVAATTKDHFRIGNVTESMTVTLLLQLVDEGRVSLDDPISTWFPDLPRADEVTVGMLARSTSGYAHYATHPDFVKQFYENPKRRWKVAEVLSLAFSLPPLFEPPGSSWAFSDTNFLLLGKVLRRVGGEPVERLMQERIWDELGMRQSALRVGPHIRPPVLHGFTRERGFYEDSTFWSPSIVRRAANATSTLGDLGKWANALGTGTLVSRRSHALQVGSENVGLGGQTEAFHYAMGSGVSNDWIYNNPHLFGYKGLVTYLPAKDVAIVVFTTDGPRAKPGVLYTQGIVNRVGELFDADGGPQLPFCLRLPCGH